MTHRLVCGFAGRDVEWGSPGFAAVRAEPAARLLAAGILGALIVAERGVEFAPVPGQRDPVQKAIAVRSKFITFDDVKLNPCNQGECLRF